MASKTFLFLALAFAAVLLITSEVVTAKEASSHDNDGKINVDGFWGVFGRGGGRAAGRGGGSTGGRARGGRKGGGGFHNLPGGNNGGGNECP